MIRRMSLAFFACGILLTAASFLRAAPAHDNAVVSEKKLESLSRTVLELPSFAQIVEVALLRNYNTRLVVLSTMILGIAAGLVGAFLLLRKRSLMGDALSHACLPGIGIAFMIMAAAGGNAKNLAGLLTGAIITGVAGVVIVLLIRNTTRIKDDAAMGIVLSVFFGIGVAILGMVQSMPNASAAGLEQFIYGKAASMVLQDFILITIVAVTISFISIFLLKEFTLLCFDDGYAHSLGWPVALLDIIMLALVASITVAGLQAVGLILIIAFLITPAAAARFWTAHLKKMLLLSAFIGGLSGWLGSSMSALLPRLPAGAVIVLVAALIFLVSMILGAERGILLRYLQHRQFQHKIGHQNFLRSLYEILEAQSEQRNRQFVSNIAVKLDTLIEKRTWSERDIRVLIRQAQREDDIESSSDRRLLLSESGFGEAARLTRNHRLWEMYLLHHAEVAPQHVHRDADAVEHVLGPSMVRELEQEMARRGLRHLVPDSPHTIATSEPAGRYT
ncbi:MAG: iron chelate uptake ABC transporter family permease subunit [Chitinivibrionales bacterium]|nr:iron chelate uptake ABC transporter family permease subunit [Chitinivibrionales bacterium]